MSALEEITYSAYEHGKRDELFQKVGELRQDPLWSKRPLVEIYEKAYELVMKT